MPYYRCQPPNDGGNPYVISINGVEDDFSSLAYALSNNVEFNDAFTIGNKVTNCTYMLNGCSNFNRPVTFGNNVRNISYCLRGCSKFNSPVVIGDNVTSMLGLFNGCSEYNQPINIPNKNISINLLFSGCKKFNCPVTIPDSITRAVDLFRSCFNFNQPVTISDNINYASAMFADCYNFNQPVTISNNINSVSSMFANCYKFNQPLNVNCPNVQSILSYSGINSNVTFGTRTVNLFRAMDNCMNFTGDVFVQGTAVTNVYGLFNYCNNSLRKNIWFNSALNAVFNARTGSTSMVGASVTWTAMTNGFYNALYNIYCYNNYPV